MRRWFALLGVSLAMLRMLPAEPVASDLEVYPLAFRPGEELHFNVSWGIFRRAGDIYIAADQPNDQLQRVTVDISTRGAIRGFYRYVASGQSWFDVATGRMLKAEYREEAGSRQQSRIIEFNYDDDMVHYQDVLRPERNQIFPIPDGQPLDLVSSLVSARQWDLQPGEFRDVVVQADHRFYSLRLHAEEVETIRLQRGNVTALRIVPEPIGEPEGIFRRGGRVQLWVGQDENRLPLQIRVHLRWGTAVATLVEYKPPTAPAVAGEPADRGGTIQSEPRE